jgi:hypothetical protein
MLSVITAMASQQVTKALSVLLLNRLAVRCGQTIRRRIRSVRVPRAEDLTTVSPTDLSARFQLAEGPRDNRVREGDCP